MAIVKKKVYEKMSEGLHNVVISRVDDVGVEETQYGAKDRVRIIFEALDQKDAAGEPVDIGMKVNKVITPKSGLGILLDKINVDGSGDEFDTDSIIGIKCQISVVHKKKDGNVYANVDSVIKSRKNTEV